MAVHGRDPKSQSKWHLAVRKQKGTEDYRCDVSAFQLLSIINIARHTSPVAVC